LNIDLHCHSTASDGTLAPEELARRAHARGVTHWALTDHDVTTGLEAAGEASRALGIAFVPGVEISVTWHAQTVHILGLAVDPAEAQLTAGIAATRSSRRARAALIAEKLAALGIDGALDAYEYAEDPDLIGRTHFARLLVDRGHAAHIGDAFNRYLGAGKPACVPQCWARLADAVRWIRAAGGLAVIAHPGRYRLSAGALDRLIEDFKAAGGRGIEVVTGSHSPDQYALFAALARSRGLLASRGSDFHGPEGSKADLGGLPPLPPGVEPVWSAFAVARP
jgi:predicted metal-dependent phosphoesterase TrpH